MMRVKVDEDLPRAAIQMLRDRGYEAVSVVEQQMGGWKDPPLWQAIQAEQQFLVTADKGVADIRVHPPGAHAGVLLEALARTVTVVTPRGIRIRRAGT